jgi:2',3'-cyclic-nucleotide 2'-phosphodiesterase/3'-nucleotidase/5'-nucleotidase
MLQSRFFGWVFNVAFLPSLFAACLGTGQEEGTSADALHSAPELRLVGTFEGGAFDTAAATIVAFNPIGDRMYVTNVGGRRLDVVDLGDPAEPVLERSIDMTPYGETATSVAVSSSGVVAVAVSNVDPQAPGSLLFLSSAGEVRSSVIVGAAPDNVVFTPNGRYALVANEGEPRSDYSLDPEGTISIVDLRWGARHVHQSDVRTAGFAAFEGAALPAGIRITGPGATVSTDLEPEHIAVSSDSRTAWVTLQENNALATIDVERARVIRLRSLGVKDHSLEGSGFDASDRDGAVRIAQWPISGIYQPDTVASYERYGRTYLVLANEGDARDYDALAESARCGNGAIRLDPTAYPDATTLKNNTNLGRLDCSLFDGDTDGDGDIDRIHSFGGRSFSIRDSTGGLVFDSGDEIEQTTAAAFPLDFNSNDDENGSFDTRSDNAGPEPEGLVVGTHFSRTYAFIGLERIGGVVVYDVTAPTAPVFLQYLNNRDFAGDPEAGTAGDLSPEGLAFVSSFQSPTCQPLLLVANELSGTTSIYEFR